MSDRFRDPVENEPLWAVRLVQGLFGALGLGLTVIGAYLLAAALESASWPRTQGAVARVEIVERFASADAGGTRFYPEMTYRYAVDGAVYENALHRYGSGTRSTPAFSNADAAAAHGRRTYEIGAAVTVFYDPDDPARAVLAPRAGWAAGAPLAIGLLLLAATLWNVFGPRLTSRSTDRPVASKTRRR